MTGFWKSFCLSIWKSLHIHQLTEFFSNNYPITVLSTVFASANWQPMSDQPTFLVTSSKLISSDWPPTSQQHKYHQLANCLSDYLTVWIIRIIWDYLKFWSVLHSIQFKIWISHYYNQSLNHENSIWFFLLSDDVVVLSYFSLNHK